MSGDAQHAPSYEGVRRLRVAGVTLLVVTAPLLLGGVLAWTRALVAASVALLMVLEWAPRAWAGRGPDRRERAWLAVWLALSFLVLLQLLPLNSALLRASGALHGTLLAPADAEVPRLTPMPLAALGWWASFTTYWAVAFTLATARRRAVARLAGALTALVLFEAFYGTWALAHGADRVLGLWPKPRYLGDATGTFVNHNHYAGLLALCWPLCLAWLRLPREAGGPALPGAARRVLVVFVCLWLGAALVASHSRLGLAAAGAGLLVWLAASPNPRPRSARGLPWLALAAPAAALLGAIWFGSGVLVERFLDLAQAGERLAVWRALLALPARTWLLGAGAGAFPDVFKTVQPSEIAASYLHAHNDVLELLLDFGVVGLAVAALPAWGWWRRVRPGHFGALQRGALGGVAAVAIHSLGDFDLQVPGVALPFWATLGIALNARAGRATSADAHSSRPRRRPRDRSFVAASPRSKAVGQSGYQVPVPRLRRAH